MSDELKKRLDDKIERNIVNLGIKLLEDKIINSIKDCIGRDSLVLITRYYQIHHPAGFSFKYMIENKIITHEDIFNYIKSMGDVEQVDFFEALDNA